MSDKQAAKLFSAAKIASNSYNLTGSFERKLLLRKLKYGLITRKEEAILALETDFGKPPLETIYAELYACVNEINYALRHLDKWIKPRRAGFRLTIPGTSGYVAAVPKGCVLIIAPWNYPINLGLIPVINALAAGNTVVIKPSPLVPATNKFLNSLLESVFPEGEVIVADSHLEASKDLLAQPFDHIFFTGGLETGKYVMRAAAEIPCPVTLELGGRCPAIVQGPADLEDAVRRIVWAKWLNNGQTCIAINHVLVHESLKGEFKTILLNEMNRAFRGLDAAYRPPLSKIIDSESWSRLCAWTDEALQAGAKLLYGNIRDEKDRYFSPTLLEDVPSDTNLLKEEIFGPVLPLVYYSNWESMIDILQSERPLAIVLFSDDKKKQRELFLKTRSGAFCINDVNAQLYHPDLPFGGVGSSGFGAYHGYYGFSEFSQLRSVIRRRCKTNWIYLALQPYSEWKKKFANFILRYF
jgi:aldehyde dehydrogenase (NAD+)